MHLESHQVLNGGLEERKCCAFPRPKMRVHPTFMFYNWLWNLVKSGWQRFLLCVKPYHILGRHFNLSLCPVFFVCLYSVYKYKLILEFQLCYNILPRELVKSTAGFLPVIWTEDTDKWPALFYTGISIYFAILKCNINLLPNKTSNEQLMK